MATIAGRVLFFVTSPRSPMKMVPEIRILREHFIGLSWNKKTQELFMDYLVEDPNFEGVGSISDKAFSARDRINRAPKALGFVDLDPAIGITEPGYRFISGLFSEEALLRQILKFQLPSPYHIEKPRSPKVYNVKPYLELFRLIYTLEKISFDEVMIFGMQLTDYHKFDLIVSKINSFRNTPHRNSYKDYMGDCFKKELEEIYKEEIDEGKTKTRESKDVSVDKFLRTKAQNMKDYTDACFRYLRATGLVSISQKNRTISIVPDRLHEVKYFLETVDREPCFTNDEDQYKQYLFNHTLPVLYTDDRERLLQEVAELKGVSIESLVSLDVDSLKGEKQRELVKRKANIISQEIKSLKTHEQYQDIMDVFNGIKRNTYYDSPLMFEWNTWRAMTMINGGFIKANLRFDDYGEPMNTAAGNRADILCDYGDFMLTVEVTLQRGQRQYETEGEPVSRHLANVKRDTNKPAFCFFIAPVINASCIAFFYTLHKADIAFYGGKSVIIPLELDVFTSMIEQCEHSRNRLTPEDIYRLCNCSLEIAERAADETEWYNSLKERALNWVSV